MYSGCTKSKAHETKKKSKTHALNMNHNKEIMEVSKN
jgi:hypothetical protein